MYDSELEMSILTSQSYHIPYHTTAWATEPVPVAALSSKRIRKSADILTLDTACQNLPTTTNRGLNEGQYQMEQVLMGDKEIPGTRIQWRFTQAPPLDYAVDSVLNIGQNVIFKKSVIQELFEKDNVTCGNCKNNMLYKYVGKGPAKVCVLFCINDECGRCLPNLIQTEIYNEPVTNMSLTYESIIRDSGFAGFTNSCGALQIESISKTVYYELVIKLHLIMKSFFNTNIKKSHERVQNFYIRNNLQQKGYKTGDLLNIGVSIDGSYAHVKSSRFGVTLVHEWDTSDCIDFIVTERCLKCTNSEVYESHCEQQNKKFHGPAGMKEAHMHWYYSK